jgi:predicted dehydrogenase
MTKLTSVVIGCGTISREHLGALSELPNVHVAAVCDLSAARAQATAERFGITKWYSSYEILLADVRPDMVHITTPPSSHFPIARACLSAGLNVLCEKPITTDYQQFCLLKQQVKERRPLLLENQNYRYHSSVRRLQDLVVSGVMGDLLDVQIFLSLNILSADSPYMDQNVPYFGMALPGGVIGDFLTHLAYLAYMFTGSVSDLRTAWLKHTAGSMLTADEFRAFIKGKRATAYVAFSGNAQPDGFWLRLIGTRMHAEANLFEPPRITLRCLRSGEPALTRLIDGFVEAGDVLYGTTAAFWRKLGGVSSYDGLREFIASVYDALESKQPPPISLTEIDETVYLVERFSKTELKL